MFAASRIGAIVYYVADITRTEAFYRDTLGLEVQRIPGQAGDESGGADWLLAATPGGVVLVFFQMAAKPGGSPIVVFELDEGGIDQAVDSLAKKGATIVTPVSHAPDGGLSADFADPDGHVLSVHQPGDKPR